MKTKLLMSAVAFISTQVVLAQDLTIPPSPFEKSKVVINQVQKNNKSVSISSLASENKLVVLMDMDCVGKKGIKSISSFKSEVDIIDSTPHLKTRRKILKLKMKRAMSEERLNQFAHSSSCIVGVANDVEYKAFAHNDPNYSQQTQHAFLHTDDFYNNSQWLPVAEDERAVIAVVDTGVDPHHPDLTNMMYRKNGVVVGASFVPAVSSFMDDHGHGTHVAGLAASEANNNIGGAGVCGTSCSIMPIKVLDAKGSGLLSDIANGVFWAVDNGADILNLSLGRTLNFVGMSPLELEAFRYAMLNNVFVAVAAGNDGAVLDMNGPQSWPAMFGQLPGFVTVASLDSSSGAISTFSNRNSRYVEIGAPGSTSSTGGKYVGLLSTMPGGGYASMSGTSMATPVVAGSLGLIISYYKKMDHPYNVWDIEAQLKSATVSKDALKGHVEAGRVLDLSVLADNLQKNYDDPYSLNPADAYEKFVIDLYYTILRRNYDVEGAQHWVYQMRQYKYSLESLLLSFFYSNEFSANFGNLADRNADHFKTMKDYFVPASYLTILGRLPSTTESDYWTSYLLTYKKKHRKLIRTLLGSAEFKTRMHGTRLAKYPVMAALPRDQYTNCLAKTFKGDFTARKQVEYGYCMFLERYSDKSGSDYWTGALEKGEKLENIYAAMFYSPEFREMNEMDGASDREFINILFYTIMERGALPHEPFMWSEEIKKIGRDGVLRKFLTSEEFYKVLKAKSIK